MPKRYKLLKDRFDYVAGTIVFDQIGHDYGLASDDTEITGKEHITVTLNADEDYPGFTVPVSDLELLQGEQDGAPHMKVSEALGVNGQAICDCGKTEFHVLFRVTPEGNNHIVALRCVDCKHELAVPYQHDGPTLGLQNYRVMEEGKG